MATLDKRGTTAPATSGTTWASTGNAIDGTVGTNNATYCTWTNTTSGGTGYIEISGFDFSSIPTGSTITAVVVKPRHLLSAAITRMSSITVQPYDGATAIGSGLTATKQTAAATDSLSMATLPTLAQLKSSTFKMRMTWVRAAVTTACVANLDFIDITVTYTPPTATLVTQNAVHDHAAGNVTLTAHLGLSIQNAVHDHAAGNVALTQHQLLAIANTTHDHLAGTPSLTQHQVLQIAGATHDHLAGNVTLTAHTPSVALVIANAVHDHAAGNVTLTQHQVLTIGNATHDHLAGNVTLTQHQVLQIANTTHDQVAGTPALTQHHVLVIGNAVHTQLVDTVTLTQHQTLASIQNTVHDHTADTLTLAAHPPGGTLLVIAPTVHAQTAGNLNLIIPTGTWWEWDGATLNPLTLEGEWDGLTIHPLTPNGVT